MIVFIISFLPFAEYQTSSPKSLLENLPEKKFEYIQKRKPYRLVRGKTRLAIAFGRGALYIVGLAGIHNGDSG
jgi:hypothetical protein